ncbi:hypothetical protein Hte_011248 [Hypoxylon texense]
MDAKKQGHTLAHKAALPSLTRSNYARNPINMPKRFMASCTHPTMTRLYDPNLTELLIEDAQEKGRPVSFDLLGASLAKHMKERARGPASRSDPFSLFKEMTPDQMLTYTPGQLHTILCQREHILKVAKEASQQIRTADIPPPPGYEGIKSTKPWVPPESEECRFRCCRTCRPSAEWRSFLSLDAIVDGEMPPAAATGFGFHRIGARPVIDADRLKDIGLRAVPWPRSSSISTAPALSSASSVNSSSLDEQMAEEEHIEYTESQSSETSIASQPTHLESVREQSVHTDSTEDFHPLSAEWLKENCGSSLMAAHLTPLPPPTPEEHAILRSRPSQMMKEEMEEGRFHEGPLEVDHGLAVLEESVELGAPDFITQA